MQEWRQIARDFEEAWDFPHCLGAVDGKHVQIIPPSGAGSFYFNYKKSHSLVLMAAASAKYEFIMVDFGMNGRVSDGGVIENSTFYQLLINDKLPIPPEECVGKTNTSLPFVFVGDEAFALKKNFMKPFNQRELDHDRKIFNYRLSRARRIIENVFGIMVSRFRIFQGAINLSLDNINHVVMACCTLHNYLRRNRGNLYAAPEEQDGTASLINLQKGHFRRPIEEAKEIRERFVRYFNTDGSVAWQENMLQ